MTKRKRDISITYCVLWDYSDRAVRAAHDLLHDYQHVIGELRLVMGAGGVFDVVVDGDVLYSKKATGRHANPGEVLELFRERYAAGVEVYER